MKVILTGATGMVGEGVLLECLANPGITEVLSVGRKPLGRSHVKLKEYIVSDFLLLPVDDENLKGYDACFYCAGISSLGIKEAPYRKNTYDTTMKFALATGPGPRLSFIYLSGRGTDSSEEGRLMWARVKGKTENDLMDLPFKRVFGFRPSLMRPVRKQYHLPGFYKWLSWLFPLLNLVVPGFVTPMDEVALAMIEAAANGYEKDIVEIKDIAVLVQRARKMN